MYWPRSVGWLAGANQTGGAMFDIYDILDDDSVLLLLILTAFAFGVVVGILLRDWTVIL